MIYSFRNDYSEIGHKKILEKLLENQDNHFNGYGIDNKTEELKNLLCNITKHDVSVYLTASGTLTNLLIISKIVKPYEAVISCDSGHINVHECGAVEGCGIKIVTKEGINGKLNSKHIEQVCAEYEDDHMVNPKLVYISNSTEVGTTYTLNELKDLYNTCRKHGLKLFIDGARLSNALVSEGYSLEEITKYSDVYYIGGTKNGLPYGELVVIKDKEINNNFRYHLKNKGAMLSKSFVLSIMFLEYFNNDLYLELAKNSNDTNSILREGLSELGYEVLYPNKTNQLFIRIDNSKLNKLIDCCDFEIWTKGESSSVIRLVTSWNTRVDECYSFVEFLKNM